MIQPRHTIVFLFSLLISITLKAQEQIPENQILGIGKVSLSYEGKMYSKSDYTVNFYDSPTSKTPTETITLRWNNEGGGYVEALDSDFINIKDWYIDEPYYIVDFSCVEIKNGAYKVFTDEAKLETMWIKETNSTKYRSWSEYLVRAYCVEQHDSKENPVTDEIGGKILDDRPQCWHVQMTEGDWAYVYTEQEPLGEGEEREEDVYGWIQWRKDGQLLIKYYLAY